MNLCMRQLCLNWKSHRQPHFRLVIPWPRIKLLNQIYFFLEIHQRSVQSQLNTYTTLGALENASSQSISISMSTVAMTKTENAEKSTVVKSDDNGLSLGTPGLVNESRIKQGSSESELSSIPSDIEDWKEAAKQQPEGRHHYQDLSRGRRVVAKVKKEGNLRSEMSASRRRNSERKVKREVEQEEDGVSEENRRQLRSFAYTEGEAIPNGNRNENEIRRNPLTSLSLASMGKVKQPIRESTTRIKQEVKIEEEEDALQPLLKEEENIFRFADRDSSTRRPITNRRSSSTVPPQHWQEMYDLVKSMRSSGGVASNAPVDTMGCERLAIPPNSITGITPEISRFQSLVALMLSSQTKDTVTSVAMKNLQTKLPRPGLCIDSILSTSDTELNDLIKMVGFHNRKTTYLKQTARILKDKYNSDIPGTLEGLTALPGVGPKMAYLTLSVAWDKTEGIGVDVHVHRITNLWGWNGKKGTKTPEETREMLESWLPRAYWREINWLLVGFGQLICLPRGPKCEECLLAQRGLCKAAKVGRSIKVEVKEEMENVLKIEYDEDENVKMEVKDEEQRLIKEETIEYNALDPKIKLEDEDEGSVGIGMVKTDVSEDNMEPKQKEEIPDIEDGIPCHLQQGVQPETEPTPEPQVALPIRKRKAVRSTVVAESSRRTTRSAGKRAKK